MKDSHSLNPNQEGQPAMKIHSSVLTAQDIHAATRAANMTGVNVFDLDTRGSRSRARSFLVKLSGTSNHRIAMGGAQAATWDEWGMFINALFLTDPDAKVGQYPTFEAFRESTCARFDDLTADDQHKNHTWEPVEGQRRNRCTNEECEAEFIWGVLTGLA